MLEYRHINPDDISSSATADVVDAPMVGKMRLALAIAMLLTLYTEHSQLASGNEAVWIVFGAYAVHSVVLAIGSELHKPFTRGKLIHWLDVAWFGLIVFSAGRASSVFYLSFLFAILTSSFRWGREEGARVAVASAVLSLACGLGSFVEGDLPRLLLRTAFLLSLGYMSAYWGESEVKLKHRLALLRDVTRLSNPRFGVDQTIHVVMMNIQTFFKGSGCILIMQDADTEACSLRTTGTTGAASRAGASTAHDVDAALSTSLLKAFRNEVVVYQRRKLRWLKSNEGCFAYDSTAHKWMGVTGQAAKAAADLLDSSHFISAPLSLRKGRGRIFVTFNSQTFSRDDAIFLGHAVAQAFPQIENIELLDQLASHAAIREREKIALDLHDATVQPYIGLRLGLNALRNKADRDNPLVGDIDRLIGMATEVIADLRGFTSRFERSPRSAAPAMQESLKKTAAQARALYGLDITLSMEGLPEVSDRLAVEVLHVVGEGLNNIRKHTSAQRGFVRLKTGNGQLCIQIENEGNDKPFTAFKPRSILRRAAVLGGSAYVVQGAHGGAVVHVEIPT
ncbi:MAG: two-component system sensor kinase [Herminiimonas sp.]|nr:two-component system sensor kinase [Herminiimonas sp.]